VRPPRGSSLGGLSTGAVGAASLTGTMGALTGTALAPAAGFDGASVCVGMHAASIEAMATGRIPMDHRAAERQVGVIGSATDAIVTDLLTARPILVNDSSRRGQKDAHTLLKRARASPADTRG
jgi:hypothetical protein